MHELTAHELHALFISGKVSAEEIVRSYLFRIAKYNAELNTFLSIFPETALEQAREQDHRRRNNLPLGRLAGVPIAIKDNINIHGEITTCASKFLSNYRAVFDATAIRLLKQEDAIFIGKTNMDEFAMGGSGIHSAFGASNNPWNLECTPGGSSSGSSAVVSARLAPLALGSDTGGSVRQPAAFTGIVGFKPTYGRISRYGVVAFGSSLDQIGPMAHSVKDIALLLEILGVHCDNDSTSLPSPQVSYLKEIEKPISGTTIGVPWSFLKDLNPEMRKNFEESIEVYKKLGAKIVDVDLDILEHSIAAYYIIATAEASTNLARFDGIRYGVRSKQAHTIEEIYEFSREDGFGIEVKNRIMLGTFVLSMGYEKGFYTKAQQVRTLIIEKVREAFEKCAIIALPSTPSPAFPLHEMSDPLEEYLQDLYTVGANLAGIPAISIPSGLTKDKKPIGIQLFGPQTRDDLVLRYAYAFEKATPFSKLIPPHFNGGHS